MSRFTIAEARILTLKGNAEPRRGEALRDLAVIENGYITIEDDRITAIGSGEPATSEGGDVLNVAGNVLMPAYVDCHTHTCWAGDRLDEFVMKLNGTPYLDILKAGGGIMSTVHAVRDIDEVDLCVNLMRRLTGMGALGTGTVEIKSGYGLNTETELKMLRAIHAVSGQTAQSIAGTFLGAHAIDPDNPDFIEQTIQETLPAVVSEFPGIVCDAYCEEGAWSFKDTKRLFEKASDLGCPLRVHADQFNSLGMTRTAVDMGAISVDHLEATTPGDLKYLAKSETLGVALPACGFHLDDRYTQGRGFIDAGGALAIATDYNPGSAPSPSMAFTIALACRKMGLTPAEAIVAATHNAACVLGMQDRVGSLEVGKRADLQVLDCTDERELAFEFATAGPLLVLLEGQVVHLRTLEPVSDEDEE